MHRLPAALAAATLLKSTKAASLLCLVSRGRAESVKGKLLTRLAAPSWQLNTASSWAVTSKPCKWAIIYLTKNVCYSTASPV